MISVYKYIDYHEWLKVLFEEKKSSNQAFSFRQFGSKVNLDPSFLAKVLSNKRELSEKSATAISTYLNLTEHESEYFQIMLAFSKEKKSDLKQEYYTTLMTMRNVSSRVVIADHYEYFSKWYYSAVRNLIQFYKFDGKEYQKLGKQLRPEITALQARNAIEVLTQLNFISKNNQGFYEINEMAVSTGAEWSSHAIRHYHKNNINLAGQAIDTIPKKERDISGVTINVGKQDIPHIQNMINQFRKDLIQYVNEKAIPEQVYQVNMQFFPFSKRNEE